MNRSSYPAILQQFSQSAGDLYNGVATKDRGANRRKNLVQKIAASDVE
ncbi:hypothetical protein [Chamaesiphon sp. VAR_48_metabat_135_sub]|nr:hypothetical protein [Chamaesiphon sp. VAR_48_metabat_135_sub]